MVNGSSGKMNNCEGQSLYKVRKAKNVLK